MTDLEAKLLASWTRENLVAYGEALRAARDPRGELIAIDLAEDDNDEIDDDKYGREAQWLGDVASAVTTKYGFVIDILDLEVALPGLERIARFARSLELSDEPDIVRDAIAILAAAPRPWLGTLAIQQRADRSRPLVDDSAAFIAATPNLRKLVVRGHRVFGRFEHPSIERLEVDGHDAIGTLLGKGTLPRVDTLDFAMHPDTYIDREPSPDDVRALLPAASFPLLRTLDISRNEPRESTIPPNCLGGRTPIFDVLANIGVLPQLLHLRVPSVRDGGAQLQSVLDRTPGLRTLDVARVFGKPPQLSHRAQIRIPPPSYWPPADSIRDSDALVIDGLRVDLDRAYEIVETATLSPAQQASWVQLWRVAEKLRDDEQKVGMLEKSDLVRVLEAFDEDEHTDWGDLRERVARLPRDIAIRRTNTYESSPDFDRAPTVDRPRATSESVDEHERALQASWDLDRLAVYADELEQLGDARGELISLDLALAREPNEQLEQRREELHSEIFSDETWIESKLGFASIKVSSWGDGEYSLAKFLAGDAARYLGACDLGGPVDNVVRDVKLLAADVRPWLRRLAVETMGRAPSIVDTSELPELWPILEELELAADDPTELFRDFAHPRVRSLRITGWPAFESLGKPWPSLRHLDLAYGGGLEQPVDPIGHFGHPDALPALRSLDLSRNEPSGEDVLLDRDSHRFQAGETNFFEVLAEYDHALVSKLTRLRLPSLRTAHDVEVVDQLINADGVDLELVEIARLYPGAPRVELEHSHAKISIPAISPWPPMDQVSDEDALVVADVTIPLHEAIFAMEKHYDRLAPAARAGWDELWAAYHAKRRKQTISAASLFRAAEAIANLRDYLVGDFVDELVDALRAPAIADKTVTVTR